MNIDILWLLLFAYIMGFGWAYNRGTCNGGKYLKLNTTSIFKYDSNMILKYIV